jgi:RNA polymerase sigma factor (sigma-70 family)
MDIELLEQHRTGSGDAAFAELLRRNVGWVHGIARRRLRDEHLAEDVAQAVFILLHRKSPRFTADRALVAWLHRTTRYASEVALRDQRRRQRRETEAVMQRQQSADPDEPQWERLAPLLDRLIERLGRRDREAVLLRFYRRMTYAEVADAMQSSEEAARKRVTRSLDKLRRWAGSEVSDQSVEGLESGMEKAIGASAVAPAGLIAATMGAALGGDSAGAARAVPIAKRAMIMMNLAKAKLVAGIVLAIFVTTVTAATVIVGQTNRTALAAKERNEGAKDFDKLAPYSGIRWKDDGSAEIQIGDVWLGWLALDGVELTKIVDFAKREYRRDWQRRIGEDLVEVLTKMGKAPGATVTLKVRALDTNAVNDLADVAMTHENRQRVWHARQAQDGT